MARLRYDNAVGTLGASLTNAGTTITFAVAPSFATITGSDYIALVLDPPTTSPNANYEVVHLTAYTASATTGTISRGQDGTTGVAHSNGVAWMCAPVTQDFVPTENVNTVSSSGSGTVTIPDVSADTISDVTLTGTPTFAFPSAAAGKSFTIILRQDGTGGRTVTWPSVTWLAGGIAPTLSTAASAVDVATFVCSDGTNWLGSFAPAYQPQATASLQNGVIGSADLLIGTISINTGTGALTFTPAGTSANAWVTSTGGVLTAVSYGGGAKTITPSLPASTKYAVIGVEIDTAGNITLVKGADTATQLNTGSLIASNSPATTSGKLRIADFAVWNNSGTYNFSDHTTTAARGTNWIDRRPWARGGYNRLLRNSNAGGTDDYTSSAGALTVIDATNLAIRLECTGVPLKLSMTGNWSSTAGAGMALAFHQDGSPIDTTTAQLFSTDANNGYWMNMQLVYHFVPSAGSHLFAPYWNVVSGTLLARAAFPVTFSIEEIVRQNSNNGTT